MKKRREEIEEIEDIDDDELDEEFDDDSFEPISIEDVEDDVETYEQVKKRLEKEGKNPFQMDCKEPDWSKYNEFLMNETRYNQLSKVNPAKAAELLEANLEDAKRRWAMYQRYMAMDFSK